jgi:hypothetical protein
MTRHGDYPLTTSNGILWIISIWWARRVSCLPATDDEEVILRIAIEEQRRVYDWLCVSYEQARVKILAFLGGGLALMTFLYSDRRLFIPHEVYGKIFYFVGLGLILGALGILFHALRAMPWEFPIETKDLKKLPTKKKVKYLEYTKERYLICYDINIKAYETKQKYLNMAFYPLIFGAIILVVLNLFGGQYHG